MLDDFIPSEELNEIAAMAGIDNDIVYERFRKTVYESFSIYICNSIRVDNAISEKKELYKISRAKELSGRLKKNLASISHHCGLRMLSHSMAQKIENFEKTEKEKLEKVLLACGQGNMAYSADGIIELLELIEVVCDDISPAGEENSSCHEYKASERLYEWVARIHQFWDEYMVSPFHIPRSHQGIGYISKAGTPAFDTLVALSKHLKPIPSVDQLRRAMAKAKKRAVRVHRGRSPYCWQLISYFALFLPTSLDVFP